MAKILSPCSAEYKRMMLATYSMKTSTDQLDKYFLVPEFQLSSKDFKGQFLLKEIIDVVDKESMKIIVMEKMTGSFQDFINLRTELDMPLTDIELEFLLSEILNIGAALEKLQMYHSNITTSKFLFSYEKKQVLSQGNILLNSSETRLHEDIVLSDIGSLYEMSNIHNFLDFSDPFLPFSELAPVNGYNAPEVISFDEQLYPLKLNGFSIGLVALSLATLRNFKPLHFFDEFNESVDILKRSGYPRHIVNAILGLLDENPKYRFTSKVAAEYLGREGNNNEQDQQYQRNTEQGQN